MEKILDNKEKGTTPKFMTRTTKRLIFAIAIIALPILQFLFFYVYVNTNSIVMAFQNYDLVKQEFVFVGFRNFANAIKFFTENVSMMKYSLLAFAIGTFITLPLALIFSYYIAKNYLFAGGFRILLYVPHIISSIVFVLIYKILTTDVSLALFEVDLLGTPSTQLATVIVFYVWIGFGTNVMMFTGSMSSIPQSLIEACHIDGANVVMEFIHVTLPACWGTLVTFIVVNIAGIFTNQMHLYTFFGTTRPTFSTFGYYLYLETSSGSQSWTELSVRGSSFFDLSAVGILITVVLVPVTLVVKWALEKYGPRAD